MLPEKNWGWATGRRMDVAKRKDNPVKTLIGEPEKT
jgi:hypothetical protein